MTEYTKVGTNVSAKRKGKFLFLRINMEAEASPSSSGKALLVAQTHGFKDISEVADPDSGTNFGLNLILSTRKTGRAKPAAKAVVKKPAAKAKASTKPKRRVKRDDDED